MKKTKLLAFVIAFAIILSTMVLPASVGAVAPNTDNILETNGQFATEGGTVTAGDQGVWVVTDRTGPAAGVRYNNVALTEGHTYIVSAEIYTEATGVQAGFDKYSGTGSILTYMGDDGAKLALTAGTWTTVTAQYTIKDDGDEDEDETHNFHIWPLTNESSAELKVRNFTMIEVKAGENLLSLLNTTFDNNSGIKTVNSTYGTAAESLSNGTVTYNNGAMYLTGVTSDSEFFRLINVPVQGGKLYKISFDALRTGSQSVRINLSTSGWTNSPTQLFTGNNSKWSQTRYLSINYGSFSEVSYVFETTGDGGKMHISLVPNGTGDFAIDNFELQEVPSLTVCADLANGATDVPLTQSINYTFSNNLSDSGLAESDFELTGGEGSIAVTGSDNLYTVTLSGLEYDTTYQLKLSGVTDYVNQSLADTTISFTTEKKPTTQPVASNLFNVSAAPEAKGNATVSTGNDTDGYDIGVTATYDGARYTNVNLEPGTYVAACKVMDVNLTWSEGASRQAQICIESPDKSGLSVTSGNSWMALNTAGEWTTLIRKIVVEEAEGYTEGNKTRSHIGFDIGGDANGTIKVKDFELRMLTALDLNDSYLAAAVDNDDTTSLYICGPATTVYYVAALYADGRMTDIKMGKTTLAADKPAEIAMAKADGYKLYIWDGNMNPLNTVFDVSYLK